MSKKFIQPEVRVVTFEHKDLICTSSYNNFESDEDDSRQAPYRNIYTTDFWDEEIY